VGVPLRIGKPSLGLWVIRRLLRIYGARARRNGRLHANAACVGRGTVSNVLRVVLLLLVGLMMMVLLLLLLRVDVLDALSGDEAGRQLFMLLLWLLLLSNPRAKLGFGDMFVQARTRTGATCSRIVTFARCPDGLARVAASRRKN